MRRVIVVASLALSGACVNSQNTSIQIPFALLSSDELQAPQPGQPCMYLPVTQAGGFFRGSGMIELDPNLNPGANYLLALQVENYLDTTTPTDSQGNPLSGPQRNNFLVTDAIVQYIPQQTYLEPNLPAKAKFLTSGRVPTGGAQAATAIMVDTLSPDAVTALTANLQNLASTQNIASPGGDVVLAITLEGTLGSGEPVVSGQLFFPLHVCVDCGNANPLTCVGLNAGTMTAGVSHGPCCAQQDFMESCISCGQLGQPPCQPPQVPGGFTCSQDSDCAGLGMPHCTGGLCNCNADTTKPADPAPDNCQTVYGNGSQCVLGQLAAPGGQTPYGIGVCSAGCASPLLVCTPQSATSTNQAYEPCSYPNDGVGLVGPTCAVKCS